MKAWVQCSGDLVAEALIAYVDDMLLNGMRFKAISAEIKEEYGVTLWEVEISDEETSENPS